MYFCFHRDRRAGGRQSNTSAGIFAEPSENANKGDYSQIPNRNMDF